MASTTTTTAVAAQASVLADSWTDREGYSYEFALAKPSPAITIDVANARPGQFNVTAKFTFPGTLTNTTAGRNAPFPADYYVAAVWKSDSPVCQGSPIDKGWASNTPELEAGFCTVSRGSQIVPANPNESLTPKIPASSDLKVQASLSRELAYPDSVDQAALKQSFSEPFSYVVARKDNTTPVPMTSCLLKSGSIYISAATADTGCFIA